MEGSMKFQGYDLQLVDLPGTYSLTSYTMEEVVARQYVQSDEVDVIIDVADGLGAGEKSLSDASADRTGQAGGSGSEI